MPWDVRRRRQAEILDGGRDLAGVDERAPCRRTARPSSGTRRSAAAGRDRGSARADSRAARGCRRGPAAGSTARRWPGAASVVDAAARSAITQLSRRSGTNCCTSASSRAEAVGAGRCLVDSRTTSSAIQAAAPSCSRATCASRPPRRLASAGRPASAARVASDGAAWPGRVHATPPDRDSRAGLRLVPTAPTVAAR